MARDKDVPLRPPIIAEDKRLRMRCSCSNLSGTISARTDYSRGYGRNMNGDKKAKEPSRISKFFGDLANKTSLAAGRASTFIVAASVVIVWAVSGPFFGFSDTWQLVINTGTTIVTFLMVFLIQNSQNRDSAAIQVKLDELIRVGAARNSLVGIEHLTDEELEDLRDKCEARARAEKVGDETVDKTQKSARRAAERGRELMRPAAGVNLKRCRRKY